MDDDFDDLPDDLLMQALETVESQTPKPKPAPAPGPKPTAAAKVRAQPGPERIQQLAGAAKIQQPVPQRLAGKPATPETRTPSASGGAAAGTDTAVAVAAAAPGRIVQPKPQALAKPSSGSAIVVSMRQKGNPVLTHFKKCAWEYGDIVADYVLGVTTCALFLSLKYHRLHPEYIYRRMQDLQGKYELRVVLTLVDISDHHDALRELSKTSMVNNVTLICCWSVQEAAHYLETYKQMEHSNFAAIRGQQGGNYIERVLGFVTAVPGLNRTEALSLITNFGSLRGGVNAAPENLSMISGWGDVKVKRWIDAVNEPFHPRKASKLDLLSVPGRSGPAGQSASGAGAESAAPAARTAVLDKAVPVASVAAAAKPAPSSAGEESQQSTNQPKDLDPALSNGVTAALARLRQG
ncbi:uncharacterized protein BROUX77_006392 [Berkeleyomyces rouxiae]|uniref:uncharacterized protein n=1 Tax=Berkeleyomyces rouxiae TaxID=2035830 RepID=UPI003B811460